MGEVMNENTDVRSEYRVNCLGIKIWGAWERERDSIDDRIQDDGELIQRNLVQDPDIPDDGELEVK